MREFLKRSGRWLRVGWFWPLALLTLPTCGLYKAGLEHEPDLVPGDTPTSAVMCYIPKPGAPVCATQADIDANVSTPHAAVGLAQGETGSFAIEYSAQADTQCGVGMPLKIPVFGSFPEGKSVCLNCGTQIPAVYADANEVCIAQCKDLVFEEGGVEGSIDDYCKQNAKVATNFFKNTCYDKACENGALRNPPDFVDPRRNPEAAAWLVDPADGTKAMTNSLSKDSPENGNFNAGSQAAQIIASGDAWIEFGAGENGKSHVLGVSNCSPFCDPNNLPPPDIDRTLNDIEFSLSLNFDDGVYALEKDNPVAGPVFPYTPNDRFRLHIKDNHDGKAVISYTRVKQPCDVGKACGEDPVFAYVTPGPAYPLRIDTSFREDKANITNVNIVRIIPIP